MTASKKADFDRMWNTDNVAKRTQFRNRMKSKLDQIKVTFTEENARGYWMGELKAPPPKEEYRPEFEEREPRRGPPRGRGPSRGRGPPRGRGPARRP